MAVLSFTPVFWLTGGRLGEDALTFFFMTAVILGTVEWEKQPGLETYHFACRSLRVWHDDEDFPGISGILYSIYFLEES